jgi:hypothetical protein
MNPMKIATKNITNGIMNASSSTKSDAITSLKIDFCGFSLVLSFIDATPRDHDDDARLRRRIDALALPENLKSICHIQIAIGHSEIAFYA